ncbi:phosphate ABC superfamily ATP binding cassette transporter, membrane protein [Lapidilactobacillus dextrinicus DSM 20335]|uniref:Phosphate transport system permease protein PstA n=1 Tax=Lapidilactobacillus dextrinicus DSM 20335 TaxID=1423738 RepID=A0A0R2BSQ7_9LACO|nr:phosphate ABC transporter permease PstA [Lapidilactobacillus dextrinicus]KRM78700.1 phosphate ABC superfamily ATP binding cassette transporter, membrane protein [Lapidilactobacillus dextrinicus DSM 20335]QFG47425.1 phosphate ABC transporter permease PstA [Lapidilactobacillus dextrinicus]
MNRYLIDRVTRHLIQLLVGLVVALILIFLGYLIWQGRHQVTWTFLTTSSEVGLGIRDQLFNSLYLLVLTLLLSFPIALGSAVALTIYAKQNIFTRLAQMAIEVLSSLPSIIVGLFGFLFLVLKVGLGFSVLSGAIALTFFNLPILTQSMILALKNVPTSRLEAGISLGVSQWHVLLKVIIPEAIPGIISGIVLSAGRVFGEAAALIYTAGQSAPQLDYHNWNIFSANSFLNPLRPAETLAVHIWKVNTENIGIDADKISRGAIVILVVVVLLFNFLARRLSNYLQQKNGGR